METTLNGEISTESVYISVNNNTNFKIFLFLSIYTIWDRLSLKTISRYCFFKGPKHEKFVAVWHIATKPLNLEASDTF